MSPNDILQRAREFVYGNARLIDRKRFAYWFENDSREDVLNALRAYQNADGGFGNALEADLRCPDSQPAPTEMALSIMDELDAYDPDILRGVARYLRSIALPEGGFPFVFRSAEAYPYAPWWRVERDDQPSINPTGQILGYLYRQQTLPEIRQEEWFVRSVEYLWREVEQGEPTWYHDAVNWIAFLEHVPDRRRAEEPLARLDRWLTKPGVIERNLDASGYVKKVLDWAPTPDSYAAKVISEREFQEHLDHLIREQQEDGGWPINWEAPSPAAEQEWRGWMTVQRLKTLRAFGRL